MYFGDYLVNEKIITTNQLLEALCFQLESMPSFFKILFEKQLVSSDKLLSLIKEHIKNDFDLISALESKKLLTKDQVNLIMQTQISQKIPLGQVLVKLQFISSMDLMNHLENYYKVKDTYGMKESSGDKESSEADNDNISDAALDSLRELGIDVSELMGNSSAAATPTTTSSSMTSTASQISPRPEVKHFLDVFNEKQKNKILKLIDFCLADIAKGTEIGNYFNSLFRDIHLVRGAVSFSEIESLEKPLSKLDDTLDKKLALGEANLSVFMKQHSQDLQKCIESLWHIRLYIDQHMSDQELEKLEHYSDLCNLVSELTH
jgi:hypothetical protein